MGNSTITLQAVMDSLAPIGDLQTVLNNTGGWADEPALSIGNDVMKDLLSVRFPWKWNRMKIPPFPLIALQQDYASLNLKDIGWLESGRRVDINNTMFPPPSWPIYAVRDLEMNQTQGGFPFQFCWFYNRDLEQGPWPGPNKTYIWPIGTTPIPENYQTNILDSKGNILVLTTFGTTGATAPVAPDWTGPGTKPSNWPVGQVIQDGTCKWTVADPDAQGFRFSPIPPNGGQVWLMRLFAQRKAPTFTSLNQTIDPVPDDQENWFRDGAIAYAHRYSSNPAVKARYAQMKVEWIQAMEMETKENDREDESKGFFPDKSVMSPSFATDPGPWPYRWWGWR